MNSNISEIKRRIWNGSINIRILWKSDDDFEDTKEFLLNCYRNEYFPLYFQQIINYFKVFRKSLASEPIWLEYEGAPIKWNLPIGLLYDSLHLPLIAGDGGVTKSWVLKLNTAHYPNDQIIPFIYRKDDNTVDYEASLKEVVINSLKQSCFILNGNARPIMNLSENDSDSLWDSIKYHNLQINIQINNKLLPKNFLRIPMKIHILGTTTVIQKPVNVLDIEIPVTLNSALRQQLPELFAETISDSAIIYIHGINTKTIMGDNGPSLVEVWSIFRCLDNFLYVTLVPSN